VSTLQLVLYTESTANLIDQLSMAEGIAYRQQAQIRSLTTARNKASAAKKNLDSTLKTLKARRAELASKKATILADIAAQQEVAAHLPPGELNDPTPQRPVACPYTSVTGAAAIAVRVACDQIGKPYVFGAVGPRTFDCSGLMTYAWGIAGRNLRHYTVWQWEDTTPITASQLRPGDLVFYFPPTLHHVAMYVGGGWVVNAPHTGDVVRMAKINRWPIAGYRRV
jgi:cell wall-associated NlpC family hydrolase